MMPMHVDLARIVQAVEMRLADVLAPLGCWLAPLPSAALVARATQLHLRWPTWVAVVAGVVVETVGFSTVSTALTLWTYEHNRRKSDPSAPWLLAVALVMFYFVVVVGLTVLLDSLPRLALYAPAVFPCLACAGAVNMALRVQHRHRLDEVARLSAERRAARLQSGVKCGGQVTLRHSGTDVKCEDESVDAGVKCNADVNMVVNTVKPGVNTSVNAVKPGVNTGVNASVNASVNPGVSAGVNAGVNDVMSKLLELYIAEPTITVADVARRLGLSRPTIYRYNKQLERECGLRREDGRWVWNSASFPQ